MKFFFASVLLFLLSTQAGFASLRDPTHPDNYQETPGVEHSQNWQLQAIIISKHRSVAIFNGQALHLGSQISGFRVVSILPNTVHLEGPDGKMTLFLFNQTIKRSRGRT